MTRASQQGDGITPIVVGSGVHGMHIRMGCRKRMDWKWREGVKNGVHSYSKMNIIDGIGRRMELRRERNDHSFLLCFLRLYCRCDGRVKHSSGLDKIAMQLNGWW